MPAKKKAAKKKAPRKYANRNPHPMPGAHTGPALCCKNTTLSA